MLYVYDGGTGFIPLHIIFIIRRFVKMVWFKLIIDGNAVYEIDEDCMEKRRKNLEMTKQKQKGGFGYLDKGGGKEKR